MYNEGAFRPIISAIESKKKTKIIESNGEQEEKVDSSQRSRGEEQYYC